MKILKESYIELWSDVLTEHFEKKYFARYIYHR